NSVHSFSFELTYDPDVLEYKGFLSGENTKNIDYFDVYQPGGPGMLKIGGFELGENIIQSGSDCVIAYLEFDVIGCEVSDHASVLTIGNLEDDFLNWSYSGGLFICIIDNDPPVPDIDPLPYIIKNCGVELDETEFPTATDELAGTIKAVTNDSLNYNELGEYTITWIYNDGFGNTTSQEQKIVIRDEENPSILKVEANPAGTIGYGRSVDLKVKATDNCGEDMSYKWLKGNTIIGEGPELSYKFGKGKNNVIVMVTDKAGNTSVSDSIIINVKDKDSFYVPPGYGGSNLFGGINRTLPSGGLPYGSNYNNSLLSNFPMYPVIMSSLMKPHANTYLFPDYDYNFYSYGYGFPFTYYNKWTFTPIYDSNIYYNTYMYNGYFPISNRYLLPQANQLYYYGYTNQLTTFPLSYPLNYPQYGTNMSSGILKEYIKGFSQGNYGKLPSQGWSWQD
ncbi:MAG: hypothetical protein ACMUHX_04730, partial [bacterium]